jgi:transposase
VKIWENTDGVRGMHRVRSAMEPDIGQSGGIGELFEGLPVPEGVAGAAAAAAGAKQARSARARVVLPNRTQIELRPTDLESLLPEGHRAPLVWAWVERQDLSAMYETIKVREGGVGRSAIAPEILLALWLYATLEGVGSARQLSALVLQHDAYRWITGGVQVNYHSLSDFRGAHGKALDELLSTSVAALMAAGAVKLQRVAQDGVRVRASVGGLPGVRQPPQDRRAATCAPGDAPAHARSAGSLAGAGGHQAAQWQQVRSAGLQHRCGCHGHEDGRRGFPTGVQHPVRQ